MSPHTPPALATLARRAIEEVWTRRDPAAVRDLYADDFVGGSNLSDVTVRGPEAVDRYTDAFAGAMVRPRFEIVEQVCEGDRVVTRWHVRTSSLLATLGEPGHAGPVETAGMTIHAFRDGKIVRSWTYWDASVVQPPPERPPERPRLVAVERETAPAPPTPAA